MKIQKHTVLLQVHIHKNKNTKEEDKLIESELCTKCKKSMNFSNEFSFPVELTCGHEVCVRCAIKGLPEEEAELCCQVCDTA